MPNFRIPFGRRAAPPAEKTPQPLVFDPPSIEDLLLRAEAGNAAAMSAIGGRYYDGDGVVQDYRRAAEWLLKAESAGDVLAAFVLANMYAEGKGVEQNGAEALRRLRGLATRNSGAIHSIGLIYFNGAGVAQNAILAYLHFRIAANFRFKPAIDDFPIAAAQLSQEQLEEGDRLFCSWKPGAELPTNSAGDGQFLPKRDDTITIFLGPIMAAVRELSAGDLSVLEAASDHPESVIMTVPRSPLANIAIQLERIGWALPKAAPEPMPVPARLIELTPKGCDGIQLVFRALLANRAGIRRD